MGSVHLITTEDGSHSLLNDGLNETYHNNKGAISESQYVYLKQGLEFFCDQNPNRRTKVLEIGFGTGLNALLTSIFASERKIQIDYVTLEPFPLSAEVIDALNYPQQLQVDRGKFSLLHDMPWGQKQAVDSFLGLLKLRNTLENYVSHETFDVIYFDAFAPSKQPEIWAEKNLVKCFDCLNPRGVLVTYCAQGQFKRNLIKVGFEVEILPGALGKKEMVRATK